MNLLENLKVLHCHIDKEITGGSPLPPQLEEWKMKKLTYNDRRSKSRMKLGEKAAEELSRCENLQYLVVTGGMRIGVNNPVFRPELVEGA